MHEMSLAEGVLQILEDAAAREGFARVRTVWLEIGRLSNVEVPSLKFCLETMTRGTLADGVHVEIVDAPGRARCRECQRTVEVNTFYDPCPGCGAHQMRVIGGTEMRVTELEVD